MNKKQLIIAWAIGVLSAICLFFGLGGEVQVSYARYTWRPTAWSFFSVILIIGGLLIYTLKDKKR